MEVRYKRSLLEHIGSTAHELAPPGLGPRFGKLLAMAYEQSVLHEVDRACVGTIIQDLVGLLEPNTTSRLLKNSLYKSLILLETETLFWYNFAHK